MDRERLSHLSRLSPSTRNPYLVPRTPWLAGTQYLRSLYFIVSVITTNGFGDVLPISGTEVVLDMLILAREELRADEFSKFQAALMWSKKYCDSTNGNIADTLGSFLEFIESKTECKVASLAVAIER